jgi:hypothetical protein
MCVSQKIRPFEITIKLLVFLLLFNEDELTQTTNDIWILGWFKTTHGKKIHVYTQATVVILMLRINK